MLAFGAAGRVDCAMRYAVPAVVCLGLLATAGPVAADFTYSSDGTNVTITGYTGSGGAVVVPAQIEGLPVTTLADYSFAWHDSVTNVVIPDSVTAIGNYAFAWCDGMLDAAIPDSVAAIGDYAFGSCDSLTAIAVHAANPSYSSVSGVLFDGSGNALIQFPGGKTGNYTIPGAVTAIQASAFHDCDALTGATIPDGVLSIGDYAFENCGALTNVTIGNGVTTIGFAAFRDCPGLAGLVIGGSVTVIREQVFRNGTGLVSVTIPGSAANIGDSAFAGCTNLLRMHFMGDAPDPGFFGDAAPTVYYRPGTTGWGGTFDGRPAVLWNPFFVAVNCGDDTVSCTVTGTPDIPIGVDISSNLPPDVWLRLITTNLAGGSLSIDDPGGTNTPCRFYRIVGP